MNRYLVYLNWPEDCFRNTPEDFAFLRTLVPAGSLVQAVENDAQFLAALPEATHAIVWHFHPDWFARAPHLRVLATPSAGRELVPLTGPAGVTIHFGGFHGAAIAESVLGYMLAWCRGILRRRGNGWQRVYLGDKCYRLAGTKAVILGYGRIGHAIEAALAPHGVRTVGIRRANRAELPAALADADWLIAVLPSDTGTDGLVSAEILSKLPKRAVFINVGRGNCVDEPALGAALRSGALAGAILDVVKREPPQEGDPLMDDTLPNLTRMSHSAAFYPDYVKDCFRELAAAGLLA